MSVRFQPTDEQQAIIDYPLAPLRVAAGAGTGKTTTLAYRVAAAVDRHGIRPDQVLGITFTNKAAHELSSRMREVLQDRLGPGESVEILTYHGFAAALLQEHGLRVGIERSASIVTPTFARQLLLDAVTRTDFTHVDITARRKIIGDLTKLSADLGDNLHTAAALVSDGPPDEPAHPIAPDPDLGEVASRRSEYGLALLRYEARKRDLNTLDYADLIRLAHELVTSHPDVAAQIRDRYQLVLLDEYQDTNPAQRQFLQALFAAGLAVTAVGDQDQTIYEWRGASLSNFSRFTEHFPVRPGVAAETLSLTLNRRSGRAILDVANLVRSRVSGAAASPLRALEGMAPGRVRASWYRTSSDEANAIAAEILGLAEAGTAWRDIAVLFRKNKDTGIVRDTLEDHGIPIQVANLGGLLTIPEVVEVHAWLRALNTPEDTPALARILMGAKYRLGMSDIRRLADWVRSRDRTADIDDGEHLPKHTLIEALEHADEVGLTDDAHRTVQEFMSQFRKLLTAAQGTSLVELVQRILNDTGRLARRPGHA